MLKLRKRVASFFATRSGPGISIARSPVRRTLCASIALGALGALLGAPAPAAAQTNLLTNPNFEDGGPDVQGAYGFYTEYSWWFSAQYGNYSVRTNPATWNPGIFPSCTDHTPSTGVNMMCVDGDTHRVVWAETLSNLQPASYYRFRYWYLKLDDRNPAVLRTQFRPEADWNASTWPSWVYLYYTPPASSCAWQRSESTWFSAGYTVMTIVLDNVQSGSTGADFAIDDMEFVKVDCIDPPVITSDPMSLTRVVGQSAAFAVGVQANSTVPATYRWRKSGVPLADGQTGSGSTIVGSGTVMLSIINLGLPDRGWYDCVVTTPCGTDTSAAASLNVIRPFP